jgi:hypothetical protein
MIPSCSFRSECGQLAYDAGACYYHAKTRDGLITHRRGYGYDSESRSAKIVPVTLSPAERAEAERRRVRYYERLARAFAAERERERLAAVREDAAWVAAIGYRGAGPPPDGRAERALTRRETPPVPASA